MSIIDKMLTLDKTKATTLPIKEMEIKRLSEMLGEPFIVKVQGISSEEFRTISNRVKIIGKKKIDVDNGLFNILVLTKGIIEPDLTNKQLLEHFDCSDNTQLADKLFLWGEQTKLVNAILELSGEADTGDDEDIKKQ